MNVTLSIFYFDFNLFHFFPGVFHFHLVSACFIFIWLYFSGWCWLDFNPINMGTKSESYTTFVVFGNRKNSLYSNEYMTKKNQDFKIRCSVSWLLMICHSIACVWINKTKKYDRKQIIRTDLRVCSIQVKRDKDFHSGNISHIIP